MKRLSILRHAKAEKSDGRVRDIDRPLTERGREDAARMGALLKERNLIPDFVLCSAALRTRETLEKAEAHIGSPQADISEDLYNASQSSLLQKIHEGLDDAAHVLLIAHNPGVHLLALALTGPSGGDAGMLERMAAKFPPGALAVLEFSAVSWRGVDRWAGKLILFATPSELRNS